MRSNTRLLTVLVSLVAAFSLASALFEDQAGKDDWTLQNIGKLRFAQFDSRPGREFVYVVSEQGVVASLSTAKTETNLVWRRLLPEGVKVISAEKSIKDISVLLENQLVVFDFDGNMIFQAHFPSNSFTNMHQVHGVTYVTLVSGSELTQYSSAEWKNAKKSQLKIDNSQLLKISSNGPTTYFAVAQGELVSLGSSTESKLVQTTIKSSEIEGAQIEFTSTHAVFVSKSVTFVPLPSNGKIGPSKTFKLPSSSKSELYTPLQLVSGSIIAVFGNLFSHAGPVSVEGLPSSSSSTSSYLISTNCPQRDSCLVGLLGAESKLHVASVASESDVQVSFTFDLLSKVASSSEDRYAALAAFELQSNSGSASSKTSEGQGRTSLRWVVQTSDWTLTCGSSSGKKSVVVNWTREESLAVTTASIIVDLPAKVHEALLLEDGAHLLHRLQVHYEQLVEYAQSWIRFFSGDIVQRIIKALMAGQFDDAMKFFLKPDLEQGSLHKDHFGFAKLLISATSSSKLVCIHSTGRNIVWTTHIPSSLGLLVDRFLVLRKSSEHGPVLLALGKSQNSPSAHYSFEIQALTGAVSNLKQYDFDISSILTPSLLDSEQKQVVLFVNANRQLCVDSTTAQFELSASSFHFYLAEESTGIITGYGLSDNIKVGKPTSSKNSPKFGDFSSLSAIKIPATVLATVERWNVHLGSPIDAIAQTEIHTISPGKVIGTEKEVLPKYLNPNLIAVGTTQAVNVAQSSADSDNSSKNSNLQVAIIDTVTGTIVHRIYQRGAIGRPESGDASLVSRDLLQDRTHPMRMKIVFHDNWFIFTYWSSRSHRFELTSVELFEKESNYAFSAGETTSYGPQVELDVKSQSFILMGGIRAIGVTRTLLGISNQDVLIVYQDGKVSQISTKFLDPRRPYNQDNDPTLRQYFAYIPLDGTTVINYHNTLSGVHTVLTNPTSLESSTIVWVSGLDSFVRLVSQNSFDRLAHDYSFLQIFTILIGLGIAVYVFKFMSHRKALNEKWK